MGYGGLHATPGPSPGAKVNLLGTSANHLCVPFTVLLCRRVQKKKKKKKKKKKTRRALQRQPLG